MKIDRVAAFSGAFAGATLGGVICLVALRVVGNFEERVMRITTNVVELTTKHDSGEKDYAVVWTMTGCEIVKARSAEEARARFRFFSDCHLAENRNELTIDEVDLIIPPRLGDGS